MMGWIVRALVALLALAAMPAAAQDFGLLGRLDGKTFIEPASRFYYQRVGTRLVIRGYDKEGKPFLDAAGKPYADVVIEADGRVSAPSIWIDRRYEFYANGAVLRTPTSATIITQTPAGDLRYLYKASDGTMYDYLFADAAVGDPLARAQASSRATALSGERAAASRALYDRYLSDPAGTLGAGAIAQAAPPPTGVVAAAPRPTGPRLALIIANSRYTPVLGSLPNPANDGRLLAGALRASGFQVEIVTDADQRAMKQAISRLGERLAKAGPGATGLFYYAGHGVQSKGVNYLMPVNAEPKTEADVDLDGVAADTVLRQLEEAGAGTSIVILDACRDMPLAKGSRSASRGLARMDAPGNSYLVYSTAPGQTATDGGGANSPFASALAAEMARPNQPIETVFRNVRRSVLSATGNRQTPWVTESLSDSFVFTPR